MSYYDNATLMALKLGPWRPAESADTPHLAAPRGRPARRVGGKARRWILLSLPGRTPRPPA